VDGQIVLAVVLGMVAASFVWIRKLAASKPPNRFLPHAGQRMDPLELQIVAHLTDGVDGPPPQASGQLPARERTR
jgi:hypothetical protein